MVFHSPVLKNVNLKNSATFSTLSLMAHSNDRQKIVAFCKKITVLSQRQPDAVLTQVPGCVGKMFSNC